MRTPTRIGLAALFILTASNGYPAVRYVDLNNPHPASPYASWATAAIDIQAAIDVAAPGDTVVVTNGVYRTGGRAVSGVTNEFKGPFLPGTTVVSPGQWTNRVAVTKALAVQSVNGPALTAIEGSMSGVDSGRCVFLTNSAMLSGFTLTNGLADTGGGVWCLAPNSVVSNCIVVGNQAAQGGGTFSGTLQHCLLLGNHATYEGGGRVGEHAE